MQPKPPSRHARRRRGAVDLRPRGLQLGSCGKTAGRRPRGRAQPSASVVPVKAPTGPICPLTGLPQGKHQLASRPPLAVKIDNVVRGAAAGRRQRRRHRGRGAGRRRPHPADGDLPVQQGRRRRPDPLGPHLRRRHPGAAARQRPGLLRRQPEGPPADHRARRHGADLPGRRPAVLLPRRLPRRAAQRLLLDQEDARRRHLAPTHNLKAPKPLFSYGPIDPSAQAGAPDLAERGRPPARYGPGRRTSGCAPRTASPDRLASGTQISTTNVVIMSVNIASTGLHDVLGNPSPLDVTVGSNPVWVLRNGKMIKGTWTARR